MPSPHFFYGHRVILIVSAYFYKDMELFWTGSCGFELVAGGLGGGWVVADGFGWFAVLGASSDVL